ncbi:hypothetical protein RHSIM_Rhsim04G0130000 [Rhododendron simsii]|uniref:Uncharacterized protein n=1 Tax=Rhododendron simsii TaxID=118357 RepID=A0A834LRP9_RHOSS|nr:hypothetical protein RHSIM_Rhsim04G0130000 [Rhododendron simsii]
MGDGTISMANGLGIKAVDSHEIHRKTRAQAPTHQNFSLIDALNLSSSATHGVANPPRVADPHNPLDLNPNQASTHMIAPTKTGDFHPRESGMHLFSNPNQATNRLESEERLSKIVASLEAEMKSSGAKTEGFKTVTVGFTPSRPDLIHDRDKPFFVEALNKDRTSEAASSSFSPTDENLKVRISEIVVPIGDSECNAMVVTSDSPIIDPNPKQDLEPLLTVPPPVLTNPFHLLEEGDKVEDDNSDSPLTPTPSDLNLLPNFIASYGGEIQSVSHIHSSLKEFRTLSGLAPCPGKRNVFFSGVSSTNKLAILEVLGFTEGALPVRYLGVPLLSSKLQYKDSQRYGSRIMYDSGIPDGGLVSAVIRGNNWAMPISQTCELIELRKSISTLAHPFDHKFTVHSLTHWLLIFDDKRSAAISITYVLFCFIGWAGLVRPSFQSPSRGSSLPRNNPPASTALALLQSAIDEVSFSRTL